MWDCEKNISEIIVGICKKFLLFILFFRPTKLSEIFVNGCFSVTMRIKNNKEMRRTKLSYKCECDANMMALPMWYRNVSYIYSTWDVEQRQIKCVPGQAVYKTVTESSEVYVCHM